MKQRTRRLLTASMVAAAVVGLALLRWSPPEQSRFYPRCPIYSMTHLLCPGCGATRALAALLRGDLTAAMHLNALFILLLPLLATYAAVCAYRAWTAERFTWPTPPPTSIQTALALALLFTIARNIPH